MTIKLTGRTLDILKNFATINPSMVFNPGQEITTISSGRKVLAKAIIDQKFESTFGIFELNKLFGAISLFKDPTIKVEKSFLNIAEGPRSLKYIVANPSDIKAPGEAVPWELPSVDTEFMLTEQTFKNLMKAAGVLSQPDILIEGDGTRLTISTINAAKPSSEGYRETIEEFIGGENPFKLFLKVENLKLYPGSYVVQICSKKITRFDGSDVMYIVAAEANSSF